jgi:hypothetical protein
MTTSPHDHQVGHARATLLTALTHQKRAQAMGRFDLLRPFLHERLPLTHIARQQQLPVRTLKRWVQRYRTAGLAGLVRQRRCDVGRHRLPPTLTQLIEGLALQNRHAASAPSTARAVRGHGRTTSNRRAMVWSMPWSAACHQR